MSEALAPRWLAGAEGAEPSLAALLRRVAEPDSLGEFDAEIEAARAVLLGVHHHVELTQDATSLFVHDAIARGGLEGATRALMGSSRYELAFPASHYVDPATWVPGDIWSLKSCRAGMEWVGFRNGNTGPWDVLRAHVETADRKESERAAEIALAASPSSMTARCVLAFVFSHRQLWVEQALEMWERESHGSRYRYWEGYCLLEATTDPAQMRRIVAVIGRSFPSNELAFASWARTLERVARRVGGAAAPLLEELTPLESDFKRARERARVLAIYQRASAIATGETIG